MLNFCITIAFFLVTFKIEILKRCPLIWNIFMIFLVLKQLRIFFFQLQNNSFWKSIKLKFHPWNLWYLNMAGLQKNWRVGCAFFVLTYEDLQRIPRIKWFFIIELYYLICKTQRLNFILFLIINILKCTCNFNAHLFLKFIVDMHISILMHIFF